MRVSTARSDAGATPDIEACSADDVDIDLGSATIGRETIPTIYLHWCYHFSRDWVLWCLIGNVSREEVHEIEHLSTMLPRIDFGIGIHLIGGNEGNPIRLALPKSPLPIHFTIIFEDGTTTKLLDYRVYSQWANINSLLNELAQDGIVIDELWDVNEDMQIGSGDWDASIQPGSVIYARSLNDKRGYHADDVDDCSDCESDDGMIESDEDGHDTGSEYKMSWKSSAKNTRNEHTWWFARWRQRVEKAIPGRDGVTDEPSWFMTILWSTTTITIIALLILLNQ